VSYASCMVCGGAFSPSSVPGLLQCDSCSFVTADVALSTAELASLYSKNYFAGEEYRNYVGERELIERHFRIRLRKLLRYTLAPSTRRLLEIGSAYGFFLSVGREHFASVEGIDISQDAANYANEVLKLPVRVGDFLDYTVGEKVDVVCLWDTIEHLKSPNLYLQKVAQNMNPGGIIAVTTGDIGSLVARLRGRHWRQIHPPTHLHYFSKRTLARLLAKYGFRVVSCSSDGMFRSVDMIAHIVLNIRHKQTKLYKSLKQLGLLNWNIYLNLYDIMFVIAQFDPPGTPQMPS
jgi:2-polyprenyl-3-methyl-5-hydroxy-6-metoxy-1,4-benzoquinol methylase